MRRVILSPNPSASSRADSYSDDDSVGGADRGLRRLDQQFDETERALTDWSGSGTPYTSTHSPYTGSSYSGSRTPSSYAGTHSGASSYLPLPNTTPRRAASPSDSRVRLSRITEYTENSRPTSSSVSTNNGRQTTASPEAYRRPTTVTPGMHSRSSTDPGHDRTLPPPGRAIELISMFESNKPTTPGHSRTASVPAFRSPSPNNQTTSNLLGMSRGGSSHEYSIYGSHSRPTSPSKPTSYADSRTLNSSALSSGSGTGANTAGSSVADSRSYTETNGQTRNPSTFTGTNSRGTGATDTYADTSVTFTSNATGNTFLRRPTVTPHSPEVSIRNVRTAWNERALDKSSNADPALQASGSNDGLFAIRRQAQQVNPHLRDSTISAKGDRNSRTESLKQNKGLDSDNFSIKSGVLPPGFDAADLMPYTQSNEAVSFVTLTSWICD